MKKFRLTTIVVAIIAIAISLATTFYRMNGDTPLQLASETHAFQIGGI